MGMAINSEGLECESVKWHTRQKHAFLEEYLKIWSEQVGKKKISIPTFSIFDLHASYGWCHCKDSDKTWKGSALLSADCLKNYPKGRLLFMNTYNPVEGELHTQKTILNKNISDCQLPARIETKITTLQINETVEKAISSLDPKYPSLWILDPYKAQDLPWSVVEKICKLKGDYGGKGRRPELFINLMTHALQRSSGKDDLKEDIIGITLGMEKDEWKLKLEQLLAMNKNTREAFIIMYAEKLFEFYEKEPIILEVPSTTGGIVYTIFLCTDHPAGHYVMKLHKLKKYHEWHEFEWKGIAESISEKKKVQRKAEKNGHTATFLGDF